MFSFHFISFGLSMRYSRSIRIFLNFFLFSSTMRHTLRVHVYNTQNIPTLFIRTNLWKSIGISFLPCMLLFRSFYHTSIICIVLIGFFLELYPNYSTLSCNDRMSSIGSLKRSCAFQIQQKTTTIVLNIRIHSIKTIFGIFLCLESGCWHTKYAVFLHKVHFSYAQSHFHCVCNLSFAFGEIKRYRPLVNKRG